MASALRQGLSAQLVAPKAASSNIAAPLKPMQMLRGKAIAPARRTVSGPARTVPPPLQVAAPESPASQGVVEVFVDNNADAGYTVITVLAANKPGLLTSITVRNCSAGTTDHVRLLLRSKGLH